MARLQQGCISERKFVSKLCLKLFYNCISIRMRHYAVHGADKRYKCHYPNCTRKFADSTTLKRHLLVHSGEKPYECDWADCNYRCNSASGLKVHKRRHTGERPYKCDWPGCGSAFICAR